jgi:hypothetical protein
MLVGFARSWTTVAPDSSSRRAIAETWLAGSRKCSGTPPHVSRWGKRARDSRCRNDRGPCWSGNTKRSTEASFPGVSETGSGNETDPVELTDLKEKSDFPGMKYGANRPF